MFSGKIRGTKIRRVPENMTRVSRCREERERGGESNYQTIVTVRFPLGGRVGVSFESEAHSCHIVPGVNAAFTG